MPPSDKHPDYEIDGLTAGLSAMLAGFHASGCDHERSSLLLLLLLLLTGLLKQKPCPCDVRHQRMGAGRGWIALLPPGTEQNFYLVVSHQNAASAMIGN